MKSYDEGVKAQELGKFQEAEKLFEKARKAAKKKKDKVSEALSTRRLGFLAQMRADFSKAEELYELSVKLFEKADKKELCATLQQYGMVAHKRGDLKSARERYESSLREAKKLDDASKIASSQHLLGMVADDEGNLDEAQEWLEKSLKARKTSGDEEGMACTYHQLGQIAHKRNDLEAALDYHRMSLELEEKLQHTDGQSSSLYQIANLAHELNRLDEAASYYKRALEIEKVGGDKQALARICGRLAMVYEKAKKFHEAMDWLIECLALSQGYPHPAGPYHLARLIGVVGMRYMMETWQKKVGTPLPREIRIPIEQIFSQVKVSKKPADDTGGLFF